jgi:hypothetical protein
MTKKKLLINTVLSAALLCTCVMLAQTPVQNIDKNAHANLAQAQNLVAQAYNYIETAQQINKWDMKGHAENAQQLLVQTNGELKLAAEAADAANPAKTKAIPSRLAQTPVQNIDKKAHANLAQAQSLIAQAYTYVETAQEVNKWDMKGHAENAQQLLDQANEELKLAAEAADAANAAKDTTGKLEVLPVGTELVVRTNETIDSKVAKENQMFSGQIEQDVLGSSREVIVPKSSPAELVIRTISTGGITGSPEMVLDVQAITVGGVRYVVSTANLQEKSDTGFGLNTRTAEMLGGGAALGTIIGAVAGGGKGAAIGALGGTAAGAGAEVLLKGKEVRVPAETILKFKLDQPVSLHAIP